MGRIGAYRSLQELTPKARHRDIRVYKVCLRSDNSKIFVIKTFPRKTHAKFAHKEYEILKRLEGVDGIVKPVDLFEHDDRICVVENYIEGTCLDKFIRTRQEVDCNLSGRIIKRLIEIFSKMHEAGVAHRDIKPANIILCDSTLLPIVIDFDKAIREEEYIGKRTNVVGTPYYMAPELGSYYKKKWMLRDYDWKKGDVWSFGITAYLLIHGKLPHKGVSGMFDFSDVLLFLTKCARSVNPRRYIAVATNCDMNSCLYINLALECSWKDRHTFRDLQEF